MKVSARLVEATRNAPLLPPAEVGRKRGDAAYDPEKVTGFAFGIALVLIALGFKIGAVPMQAWIPDVYQGAPTPTTAFLSVGSKAAGFILLMLVTTLDQAAKQQAGPLEEVAACQRHVDFADNAAFFVAASGFDILCDGYDAHESLR